MTHGSDRIDYNETPDLTEVHAAIQREHKDPSADVTPVPLWVTLLCGVAVCWAGVYIGMFHGGFSANVFNEYESDPGRIKWFALPAPPKGTAGPAAAEDMVAIGKGVYGTVCQACHQPNGMGAPGVAPALAGSEWVLGSEKRIAGIILKGLMGPVTVKGATFSGAVMPAQEAQLSDKKIAAVMTYVRQEWGNKAGPVQPAQIAAARKEFKSRANPWTEADLLQIPADAVLEGGAPAGGALAAPTSAVPAPAAPATAAVPPTPGATAAAAPIPAAGAFDLAASIERGKAVYMQTCVTCHMPNGLGAPGAFPPLATTEYTTGDARRVVAIVIKGVNPPLKVNNITYVVPMPPPDLAFPILKDDAKLADVVNYTRNSFGNKDPKGVTPEFVAAVRKEFAGRPAPWTEAELLNFPPPAK